MPIPIEEINNMENQNLLRANLAANQNYDIQLILGEWIDSRPLRFKCISENRNKNDAQRVFSQWPFYTHPNGHICKSSIGYKT